MTTVPHPNSPTIRTAAILAWQAGDNTADIARLLDLTEAEIERILIEVREARRVAEAQEDITGQNGDELGVRLEMAEGAILG